jgi:hypothetical protein
VIAFQRSAASQVAGTGFGLIFGIAFLAMAVIAGSGILGIDLMPRIFGTVGFGFFGLLLSSGAVAALRRGSDRRVIAVGDDGAWLPGMGNLAWSEIAEVRLESIRGPGGSGGSRIAGGPVTLRYRRLGVVPRDPNVRPDVATRVAALLTNGYYSFVRRVAPDVRVGGDAPAPFGVMEAEIPDRFEELLIEVGRHITIADATQRRAQDRAPLWAGSPIVDIERTKRTDIMSLDAALGGPSARLTPVPVAGSGAPSLGSLVGVVTTPPASPSATFSLPAVGLVDLIVAIVPVISLIPVIAVFQPLIQKSGLSSVAWLVVFGILVFAVIVPWLRGVVRLIGRLRHGRAGIERLRVGPEGVCLAGGDTRPWAEIREVRTERAGFIRQMGGPRIERWRLVFVPFEHAASAAAPGITSDELDAPFDDVLDLIRSYHPVVETG